MRIQDGISIVMLLLLAMIAYKITVHPKEEKPLPEENAAILAQLSTIEQKITEIETKQKSGLEAERESESGRTLSNEIDARGNTENHGGDAAANELDQLFSGTKPDGKLNEIKRKFEGLFVNFQYLKGCGAADEGDYHLLNSALIHELASSNGPARLQYDILTAAQGTYQEIYARSNCEQASVESIKGNFIVYIEEIKKIRFVIP